MAPARTDSFEDRPSPAPPNAREAASRRLPAVSGVLVRFSTNGSAGARSGAACGTTATFAGSMPKSRVSCSSRTCFEKVTIRSARWTRLGRTFPTLRGCRCGPRQDWKIRETPSGWRREDDRKRLFEVGSKAEVRENREPAVNVDVPIGKRNELGHRGCAHPVIGRRVKRKIAADLCGKCSKIRFGFLANPVRKHDPKNVAPVKGDAFDQETQQAGHALVGPSRAQRPLRPIPTGIRACASDTASFTGLAVMLPAACDPPRLLSHSRPQRPPRSTYAIGHRSAAGSQEHVRARATSCGSASRDPAGHSDRR